MHSSQLQPDLIVIHSLPAISRLLTRQFVPNTKWVQARYLIAAKRYVSSVYACRTLETRCAIIPTYIRQYSLSLHIPQYLLKWPLIRVILRMLLVTYRKIISRYIDSKRLCGRIPTNSAIQLPNNSCSSARRALVSDRCMD